MRSLGAGSTTPQQATSVSKHTTIENAHSTLKSHPLCLSPNTPFHHLHLVSSQSPPL